MKKVMFLLMFMCFTFLISLVKAKTNSLSLIGKIIYLDAGHGGMDPGATYKEIKESDINLDIVLKTQTKLEQYGAIVYLTRYGDYDLSQPNTINHKKSDLSKRSSIINSSDCDLYLSLHLNAESSSTWKGAQVFYTSNNPENEKIASIFQDTLKSKLNTNRKYKLKNDLYLNSRINRPGILIESGFISNYYERNLLVQDSYQEKLANIIVEATIKYFDS